jgi:uroporphyrinogen decarboxylase
MTPRERILNTLRGAPTDRLARGELFIADEFIRAFPPPHTLEHVIHALDLDLVSIPFSAGWGTYQQPDADRALEAVMQWRERDRFVFALIDGPFSAAVKETGFDALMRYTHALPDVARDAFQRGADEARVVAQAARDAGAEGVILGEDIAYNRGTFFTPRALTALYFPVLRETVRALHALDLVVFFHSDGNLDAVLDDLTKCELDGLQGLEPEADMSIARARQRVGNYLTLWGNLSFDFLHAERTEAEIAQTIATLAQNSGKLILGSCGGLVAGLNVETVRRVYQYALTVRYDSETVSTTR